MPKLASAPDLRAIDKPPVLPTVLSRPLTVLFLRIPNLLEPVNSPLDWY